MKKKQGLAGGKLYEKIIDVDVSTNCVSCQEQTLSPDAADVRDECGPMVECKIIMEEVRIERE
jgi:hypothetical protein